MLVECAQTASAHMVHSAPSFLGPAPLASPEAIPEKGWLGITPPHGPIWRTYMVHVPRLFSLGFLFVAGNTIVSSFFKKLLTSLHELL